MNTKFILAEHSFAHKDINIKYIKFNKLGIYICVFVYIYIIGIL